MPFDDFNGTTPTSITAILGQSDPSSAMPTLSAIRQEVWNALGQRDDLDPADDAQKARLDSWINEAVSELISMVDLVELKASFEFTFGSNWLYSLPTNVDVVTAVSVQDPGSVWSWAGGRPLRKIETLRQWRTLVANESVLVTLQIDPLPRAFFQFNKLLAFWPLPPSGYAATIDCTISLSKLVDDGDRLPINSKWYTALIDKSIAIAHSRLGEPEIAAVKHNEALVSIRSKIDQEARQAKGVYGGLRFPRTAREVERSPLNPGLNDEC